MDIEIVLKYIQSRKKVNLIVVALILIVYIFMILILKDILYGRNIVFPYALNKFYIDRQYPEIWQRIKLYFFMINIITPITILVLYNFKKYVFWKKKYIISMNEDEKEMFFKSENKVKKKNSGNGEKNICGNTYNERNDKGFKILLGFNEDRKPIYLEEKALFQNILITGSIGTGKTSSGMYNITKQLIKYNPYGKEKIGMLILDVKGNYYNFVKEEAIKAGRAKDIVCVDINRKHII